MAEAHRRRSIAHGLACWLLGGVVTFAAQPQDGPAAESASDSEQPGPVVMTAAGDRGRPSSSKRSGTRGYMRATPRYAHIGYGPLHLSSQSPLQVLRLGIPPRPPATLAEGEYELRLGSTWVNVWSRGPGYTLDFEMLENSVSVAYGFTDTVQIEVELDNRARFGGELDGVSRWFHDTFGFGQNGREELPKDDFNFWLIPDDGRPSVVLGPADKGSFSSSAQLTLQHTLTYGSNGVPAISYALTGRIETASANDVRGPRRMDLGASVAAARGFGRIYVYATAGLARFARNDFRGLGLRRTQLTLMTAAEWRFRQRQSLLVQFLATEGLIEGFGPFSRTSHEITLGYKWELQPRTVLEAGLIENVVVFDNTPDFGLQLALSRRF